MSELMRESLSALMDDRASELELERLLKHSGDKELRQTWVRYHAVRNAIGGQATASLSIDISAGVRAAITGEAETSETPSAQPSKIQSLLRPVASLAVAASVAAVVVVGGVQWGQSGDSSGYNPPVSIASGVSPVGMLNRSGAVPVQMTYGSQPLSPNRAEVRAVYRELARRNMERYMADHAAHASLNTPQGMVPYAKVEAL